MSSEAFGFPRWPYLPGWPVQGRVSPHSGNLLKKCVSRKICGETPFVSLIASPKTSPSFLAYEYRVGGKKEGPIRTPCVRGGNSGHDPVPAPKTYRISCRLFGNRNCVPNFETRIPKFKKRDKTPVRKVCLCVRNKRAILPGHGLAAAAGRPTGDGPPSRPREGESAPDGIRTRVAALKGRCPGPLDDRGRKNEPCWTRTSDTRLKRPVLSL